MSFRFEMNKAIHLLIFSVHSLGGKAPFHKICALLYLADIRHLVRYGIPMLGDTYLSTKTGILPFNILSIYKQLKGEGLYDEFTFNFSEYFSVNEDMEIQSLTPYNEGYIAASEATCLFETIRENKEDGYTSLTGQTMDQDSFRANLNSEVFYDGMTAILETPPEFREYIRRSREGAYYAFFEAGENGKSLKQPAGNGTYGANRALPGIQTGSLLFHQSGSKNTGGYYVIAGFSYSGYALVRLYSPDELPLSVRRHPSLADLFLPVTGVLADGTELYADCSRLIFRHFREVRAWLKNHPESHTGDMHLQDISAIIKKTGSAPVIPLKTKKEYNL